ncbi:hypothetical protein M3M33_15180, partial [Loigolactobacillus coryniformis]|uniref:hypothetical protein n=1 Tax=Loigolactobacillus coryniformis TaxID=1610 RepID=UPI00201B20BB
MTENPGVTAWDSVSMTRIRRIWPTFNFAATIDFNADGDMADAITLAGSECLVFFLGGSLSRDTDGDGTVSVTEASG